MSLPVTVPNRPTPAKWSIPFLLKMRNTSRKKNIGNKKNKAMTMNTHMPMNSTKRNTTMSPMRRNTSSNSPTAMINAMPMIPSHQTGVVRMTARPIVTISIGITQRMTVSRSGYFQVQYPLVPSFPTVSTNRLCGAECMEFTTLRLVAFGK